MRVLGPCPRKLIGGREAVNLSVLSRGIKRVNLFQNVVTI